MLIVPSAAVPLVNPLTYQVTPVFVEPVTWVENCVEAPHCTVAVAGLTVIETDDGFVAPEPLSETVFFTPVLVEKVMEPLEVVVATG